MDAILIISIAILLVLIVVGIYVINKIQRKSEEISRQNIDILIKINRILNITITHLEQGYEQSEKH